MAWLSGWTYRKEITLSRASGAVTNYQMKLLVGESAGATGEDVDCNSHCQLDFGDVRFTTSNGTTLLDYFKKSITGTTPNQLATFWIEFDSVETGATTFYMYYGTSTDDKLVYYNGYDSLTKYAIGLAIGSSDYGFNKHYQNPILQGGPGNTDLKHVAQPFVIKIGSTYYMYYSGYSNVNVWSICLATSSDGLHWIKSGSNPILSKGTAGAWDDEGVNLPTVYDTGVAGAKRYRMLYTGNAGGGIYQTGYAYSSDGIAWTKGAANPVIPVGGGGQWDDEQSCANSNVILDDGTYYVYYGGHDGARYQVGLVTFTDFEGTYTKHGSNPVIPSRINSKQTLTAQTNTGTKTVTVADTSVFQTNEAAYLADGTNWEFNRVASITDGTHLELLNNAIRNYPATTSDIRGWMYRSNTLSYVTKTGSVWKGWLTCFQVLLASEYPDITCENSGYATSSDGISWTIDYANSPPLLYDPTVATWDRHSVENLRIYQLDGLYTTSHGVNTFSLFDNFERGVDGIVIGGSWTVVTGSVVASQDHAYDGAESMKLVGGATQPSTTIPLTSSANQSLFQRVWKENAATYHLIHGNGTKAAYVWVDASENIYWYDTASRDTGINMTPDAWETLELNNFDFTAGTYDIWHNGVKIKAGAVMWTTSLYGNVIRKSTGDAAGNDTYIDTLFVRNWRATEPVWGSWGGEDVGFFTLTVSNPIHSDNLTGLSLTQVHNIAVDMLNHLGIIGNIVLTQLHQLVIQTLTQGNFVNNVLLTQNHQLITNSLNHGFTVENVIITLDSILLLIQAMSHSHSLSVVTLSQIHDLIVNNILHVHALNSPELKMPYMSGGQFYFDPMISGHARLSSDGLYQFWGGIASSIEKYLKEHSGETYHQDKI